MKRISFNRPPLEALCFPGDAEWESWRRDADGVWQRAEDNSRGVMGLEAIALDSAPFWSLNHTDSPDEAVALRWEGMGLQQASGARLWTHWTVTQQHQQTLVATLALATQSSAAGGADFSPDRFEPAVQMLPLPHAGVVVWQELERFAVAFTREGALLHLAVLTSRVLDVDAAFELRDLAAALQVHGFVETIPAIHVWTHCDTDFAPQLACLFEDATIIKEARPDPRLPAVASGMLPLQVAIRRGQLARQQRQLMLLAAAAMIYVCFFGAWWLRLQWRENGVQLIEMAMAAQQPEIDQVIEAQSHWLELEPAINPDLYPVELFHQIVSLLPDEGIRLKEFEIEDGRLIVSGEATTVNHALGFKGRLAACESLQRYAWSFPVPTIRDDNRADFRAEGTLNGEVIHEGQ